MNGIEGQKEASVSKGLASIPSQTRIVAIMMLLLSTIIWWHQLHVGGTIALFFYLVELAAGIALLFLRGWAAFLFVFHVLTMFIAVFSGYSGKPQPGYDSRVITMLLSAFLDVLTLAILVILYKIKKK